MNFNKEDPTTTHARSHSLLDTLTGLGTFEKLIAFFLLLLIITSSTQILYKKNKATFVEIPRAGGKHIEGIVGTPRFINPLLAVSNADKDITSLVFAGLLTRDASGVLIPELADSYTISEDGTVYTFTLKENLTFHDETPLTADDVIFTIQQATNPSMRSPVFPNWEGVRVEKIDSRTVVFTLPEPYAPFIENLTLGILPSHIWSGLTPENITYSEFNKTPVGSGPYKFDSLARNNSGIPLSYKLTRFEQYTLGEPYIYTVEFQLYNNTSDALLAYKKGEVHALHNVAPIELEMILNSAELPSTAIHRAPLLRIFGIFFNHNQQRLLLEDEVRGALLEALPKKAIVGEILRGYGTVLNGPLPEHVLAKNIPSVFPFEGTLHTEGDTSEDIEKEIFNDIENEDITPVSINSIERARAILEAEGWKRGDDGIYIYETEDEELRLAISFSTVNTPELVQAAERVAESWREVGFDIEMKVFEPTDLTQTVIRPRKFETLLFGMVVGHELDLYAFWHSSQRNDPGLNIAQYADIEADALLEKMRVEQSTEVRSKLYEDFVALIQKQNPALFLYTPDFTYLVQDRLHNVTIHPLSEAHERFDTIHTWHIESDNVWPFMEQVLEH